jgi:hypothetical protein
MEAGRDNGANERPEVRVVLDLSLEEAEALNLALAFLSLQRGARFAAEGPVGEPDTAAALERVQEALEEGIEAARQEMEEGEADG